MNKPKDSNVADGAMARLPIVPSEASRAAVQRRAIEAATDILRDLTDDRVEPAPAVRATGPATDHVMSCERPSSKEGFAMWF